MPNLRMWKARELGKIKQDMDHLFDQLCSDYGLPSVCGGLDNALRFEVAEEPERILVRAVMPELAAHDIEVTVTDQAVTIRGVRQVELGGVEQSLSFSTSLALPAKIHAQDAQAAMKGDALEITLPRCRQSQVKIIRIKKG